MARKKRKKGAGGRKKAAGKKPKNRFEELVALQLNAIEYWGEYAQSAARLIGKGSYDPTPWTEQYQALSTRMVKDLSKLVGIVAGDKR